MRSTRAALPATLNARKSRVFITYRRNVHPDESLTARIFADINQAGHIAFIDRKIKVGEEWAREIERQIEQSDFIVVLLSEAAVQSEMLAREVELAHACYQRTGKPGLLPMRVNYDQSLPYQLRLYLEKLQYSRNSAGRAEGYADTLSRCV